MPKRKVLWFLCIGIYLVTLGYAFYVNWQGQYFAMTFVACITPLIVPTIMKLLKIKVPLEFLILNIVFVYFASLIGSCLGGYALPYYDKFVHCASGVVICEVAYLIYKYYLREDQRKSLMFIFLNTFHAAIALLWEIYEYALLVFFRYDAIRHFATGVHDSLTDMIVAVIGGLALSIYLIAFDRSPQEHFFVALEKKIYALNFQDKSLKQQSLSKNALKNKKS